MYAFVRASVYPPLARARIWLYDCKPTEGIEPSTPLYESAQGEETEWSAGSSEGINALQIRLF
jgi:hypothetical protein